MRLSSIPIAEKGVVLRPYRDDDSASLVEHINDKRVVRYTLNIPYPYTTKHAREWLQKQKQYEKEKPRTNITFAIDKQGKIIGGCSLMDINHQHNNAAIGYWLSPKYWGQGIMTEVVKQVTTFGFQKAGLKRVYAYIFPKNKASARVLEKAGFQYEGRLVKHAQKNGRYHDDLLFAKVKK